MIEKLEVENINTLFSNTYFPKTGAQRCWVQCVSVHRTDHFIFCPFLETASMKNMFALCLQTFSRTSIDFLQTYTALLNNILGRRNNLMYFCSFSFQTADFNFDNKNSKCPKSQNVSKLKRDLKQMDLCQIFIVVNKFQQC